MIVKCSACGCILQMKGDQVEPCQLCLAKAHFDGYAEGLNKCVEMITKNSIDKKQKEG